MTTTATVWLGTTLACTECHDHKYDPFTQREFYQLYAYFNNIPEQGLDGQQGSPVPSIRVPSPEQTDAAGRLSPADRRARKRASRPKLAKVDDRAAQPRRALPAEPREYVWVDDALPAGAAPTVRSRRASWHWVESPQPVLSGQRASERTASGLEPALLHRRASTG